MGYGLVRYNRTKVMSPIRLDVDCRAKAITEVLSSGAWTGKRCLLIGGGPSLVGFDYSKIINEFTIGVNKAFIVYNATVNYAMDARFYDMVTYQSASDPKPRELHNKWVNYNGIKVFLRHSNKFRFDQSVYYVDDLKRKAISYDLNQGIYKGSNSGFGALMLAIALGCKKIGLLGYDLKIDEKRNKTHWHEGYGFQCNNSFQGKLDKFKMDFEEFAPTIKDQGIIVENLYEESGLICFTKSNIDSFLI